MDRTFWKILGGLSLVLVLLSSCSKDSTEAKPGSNTAAPPVGTVGERNVYIACEGPLGSGSASLAMQNLSTFAVYDDVYQSVNGKLLGDVFQSIEHIGDKLFLCINNSDKVVVLDDKTRKEVGVIKIPKPRYILPVSSSKAYVSTLYSNKVYIINPEKLTITGTIEMPAQNPEGMMVLGNMIYVCTWDTACNKVYIVSNVTDSVVDSFLIAGYAPKNVLRDADGFVWILSGNVQKKRSAVFTKLAPGSADIVESFHFGPVQDPIKPVLNAAGTAIYFIGVDYNGGSGYNGIFKINTRGAVLPNTPFIAAQQYQYFWGLGIDKATDEIYVGDPKGFVQKGSVNVYGNTGDLRRSFAVGLGPGHFCFDE